MVRLVAVLVAGVPVGCGSGSGDHGAAKVRAQQDAVVASWGGRVAAGGSGRVTVRSAPADPLRQQALRKLGGLMQVDPGEVARVKLSGGRLSAQGALLTHRFAAPVPDGDTAILMYYDTPRGAWRPVPSKLSADRRTVRARVHHFSDWTAAIVDGASVALHASADLLGARADKLDCGRTARPKWVDDVSVVDDRNAPLLVCVAGDPADEKRVLVEVAVNRGYGVRMGAAAKPTVMGVDLGNGPVDWITDGIVRLPDVVAKLAGTGGRSMPVLGTETAKFSFTEAQVRAMKTGDALVRAHLDGFDAAVSILFNVVVGKIADNKIDAKPARFAAYVAAYTTVAQCAGDLVEPIAKGHWTGAFSGARSCMSSDASKAVELAARSMLQSTFPKLGDEKVDAISGKLGKAFKALAVVSLSLDAGEWLNDEKRLAAAGFEVVVYPKIIINPDTSPKWLVDATGKDDYRFSSWRVSDLYSYDPDAPTRMKDVEAHLGKGSCHTGTQGTHVSWPSLGVEGLFATLGAYADSHGQPIEDSGGRDLGCTYRSQIQVDTLIATGPHWHTGKELKIGDAEARIRQLYPGATLHDDGWWLHSVEQPWSQGTPTGDLVAAIRNGKVSSFTLTIDGEGD